MDIRVENGQIQAVILNGDIIRLRKPVDIDNYSELEETLNFIEEHFQTSDLAKIQGGDDTPEERAIWNREDLKSFLDEVRIKGSENQTFFLKKLSENPEKLYLGDLVEMMNENEMDASRRTLAGVQGSITKRAKNNYTDEDGTVYERFWEKKRDKEDERYFTLKEKYIETLQKYFSDNQ